MSLITCFVEQDISMADCRNRTGPPCLSCSRERYGPPWVQVLGLTVLAWGNSIGDFSTNMAMARKGLANMALTACYAGPVFNLLVRPCHIDALK